MKGPWPTQLSVGQGTSYQGEADHHFVTRPHQGGTGECLCALKDPGDSTECPPSCFPITRWRTWKEFMFLKPEKIKAFSTRRQEERPDLRSLAPKALRTERAGASAGPPRKHQLRISSRQPEEKSLQPPRPWKSEATAVCVHS